MTGESKHDGLVSGPELARWLGVSGKVVYQLGKAGIIVRATGGLFQLEESVRRYCEHLRAGQQGAQASAAPVSEQRVAAEQPAVVGAAPEPVTAP
jgi:hypothetical protein